MLNNIESIPLKKIGKVVKREVTINPDDTYKTVGCKLYGLGVYERETKSGHEIAATKMYQICENDLLINRIWVQKGSAGIVPPHLEGAVVTNDFPVIEFDLTKVFPSYIAWYVKSQVFWDECRRHSRGTSGRERLKPKELQNITFPLPALDEQKRIVATLDSLMERIDEARQQRAAINLDLMWDSILYWIFKPLSTNGIDHGEAALNLLKRQADKYKNFDTATFNGAHPHKPNIYPQGLYQIPEEWVCADLGSALTHLVDCVNDTPDFSAIPTKYLGLKSTNVKPYNFDLTEKWYMKSEDFTIWNRREPPQAGDIILTREAPMGNVCILPEGFEVCLTQRLMVLRSDNQFVNSRYLLHYLNSPHFKNQVFDLCRGLTTPHIRVRDAPLIKVPVAPLPVQQHIVAYLDALKSKVNELHMMQSEIEKDLEALIPSLLNKAFAGEL